VAVTQRTQQDGEWRDGRHLVPRVNVWRGQAEHLADSLAKDDRVMVTGRLCQRSWETTEGDKRSVTEIEADEVAVGCPAGHLSDQGVRVHPALGSLVPPASIDGVRGLVVLGLARGLDSPLDQPRRPLPTVGGQPLEFGVDLVGALGKGTHHVLGHSGELAVAVAVGRRPLHSERSGQSSLVGGPVDGVRGQPIPVQVPAVQRCPTSIWSLDAVGDDQVRMEQGVAFSGRPVVEPDRQHSLAGHVLDTAVTPAGPQVLVQVADRLGQASVMGGQHGSSGGWITETVEDRDTLGRPQHHIKGRHRVAAMRAAQQLTRRGVPALEHGLEPGHGCFALQSQ
jgi:hypothetical protein